MTNTAIILNYSMDLVEKGILEEVNGIPETIHTYAKWKSLGYQVRKGEKAIAQFPIWKHTSKKKVDKETGEEIDNSKMFMKTASFFKLSQVDLVGA